MGATWLDRYNARSRRILSCFCRLPEPPNEAAGRSSTLSGQGFPEDRLRQPWLP
nr:MAG: hypothetical protein [Microvirus sp.]